MSTMDLVKTIILQSAAKLGKYIIPIDKTAVRGGRPSPLSLIIATVPDRQKLSRV